MLLSPNEKIFFKFFSAFSEFTQNLNTLTKKRWALELFFFWKYRLQKAEWLESRKSPVSEHFWTVKMLKGPKHFFNLHGDIFVFFFDHSERKSAPKILF